MEWKDLENDSMRDWLKTWARSDKAAFIKLFDDWKCSCFKICQLASSRNIWSR